jgi:hypothetical protein
MRLVSILVLVAWLAWGPSPYSAIPPQDLVVRLVAENGENGDT